MQTGALVQEWLGESGFELARVTVKGKEIEVIINGTGELPPLPYLGTTMQRTIDANVQLKLKVVPSQNMTFP